MKRPINVLALLGAGLALSAGFAQAVRSAERALKFEKEQANLAGITFAMPQGPVAVVSLTKPEVLSKQKPAASGGGSRPIAGTNLFVFAAPRRIGAPIAPGVYQSVPYTCIVVVPGVHPDDKIIASLPRTEPQMPMAEPKLRLVPRK